MSYILDALRKSDQLRQQHAAPTLLLGQATAAPARQPAPLLYGGLAVILLAAGVAIGWLRPWQAESAANRPATAQAPKSVPAAVLAPRAETAPQPAPTALPPKVASAPAPKVASAPVPAPKVTSAPTPATKLAPAPAPAPEPKQALQRVVPAPLAPGASRRAPPPPVPGSGSSDLGAAPVASVMAMADLPLAIQQALPSMSISVHAYSGKPAERLVGINGRLLHEGEEIAPGLKLLEIMPDGMVLSYQGYNFRRGVR